MAKLTCERQDSRWVIRSQDFSFTLQDTWANQKVLFIVLRALCDLKTGKPLLTYQQVAEMFGYNHRQNIQNFQQEFQQCAEDFGAYLARQRKVDTRVVEVVTEGGRQSPLASAVVLCQQVAERLGRADLTPGNIQTALEAVPCTVIRPVLQRQWAAGAFHPKEEVVLHKAFAALVASAPETPVVEELRQTGVPLGGVAEEFGGHQRQQEAVSRVLNPQATVEEIGGTVRQMVFALTRY